MIRFILTRGLGYALNGLSDSIPSAMFGRMSYDHLMRSRRLTAATTIFADLDRLSYGDRELAGRLYCAMKERDQRVLNNPAKFKNRDILLRDLHSAGLNDYRACRADHLAENLRYPVFVRKIQGHGLPSDLLNDRASLEEYLDGRVATGIPLEHLVVIEHVGEPYQNGLFRKLGIFRIGDEIVPSLCGWDENWIVKIGRNDLAPEEFFREELRLVQENPFAEHFRRVFDLAGVEYGRADFGFYRGKIQVFEINTNPAFVLYSSFPSPLRQESVRVRAEKLRAAFGKIDSAPGKPIWLGKRSIPRRNRGWRGLLNRTRQVD